MPNRFTPIQAGTDPSQQLAIINKNFAELDSEGTTKVYYNAAGNVGVTEGLLPNSLGEGTLLNDSNGVPLIGVYVDANNSPIIKVAQPGNNVTTATSSQLAFDSSRKTFQIIGTPFSTSFSVTSTASFGATTVSIGHGLGYVPLTLNVANITTNGWSPGETGSYPLPYQSMATSGTIRGYAAYVILKRVTTGSIEFEIGITGGTLTLAGTITCYVIQST